MRFVVDAQLPRRIAAWLREAGHDALHTLDLPEGNRTTDQAIIALSLREHRVVVTKDTDDSLAPLLLKGRVLRTRRRAPRLPASVSAIRLLPAAEEGRTY